MCKMDQNIPKIRWSTEGFATGGAKGAKSAENCKMSKKLEMSRNTQRVLELAKKC